ncbi:MAG: transcriptional regulator GcvA [Burkholderiales bacterium]|nr:transcriptional regulator GcvA [Burkholderiales bacterium]
MPSDHPRRLPPLELLVAFDAAARHLSFTKAAAERFLTQSAVSRQIAALEEDLGVPLFHRRHRALELTEEGSRLARAATSALAGLREAVQTIRAPRQREVVALTTTPGFASLWLIPRLARFVAEHPRIDVRIDASYDTRSLAGEGFDVAVRYGPKDRRGIDEVDALFAETVQPLCAPSLLRGAVPLRRPQDLVHHTLLHIAMSGDAPGMPLEWQAWLQSVGASAFEPAATLTFTNYDTAAAAAVEGQGVLLGRRPLTDGLIAQGRLVAPFKGQLASARGYYLVLDAVAAQRPPVAALVQWLRTTARGEAGAVAVPGGATAANDAKGASGGSATAPTLTAAAPSRRPRTRR